MNTEIIFDGADLACRVVSGAQKDRLVITFDYWKARPSADDHGFYESYFVHAEIDAIHIVAKDNHWFESPELEKVIALVSPLAKQYSGVLGFGSSMGGYGAMHFAARMGAQIVIALSPLFDVRPQHPPFDQRWVSDTTNFPPRRTSESKFPPAAIIVYDPRDADRHQVELYRGRCFLHELRLPFAGHPSTWVAHESGLLQLLLTQVLDGGFDMKTLRREYRRRRAKSPYYLRHLAKMTRSKKVRKRLRHVADGYPAWVPIRMVTTPRKCWKWIWSSLIPFLKRESPAH